MKKLSAGKFKNIADMMHYYKIDTKNPMWESLGQHLLRATAPGAVAGGVVGSGVGALGSARGETDKDKIIRGAIKTGLLGALIGGLGGSVHDTRRLRFDKGFHKYKMETLDQLNKAPHLAPDDLRDVLGDAFVSQVVRKFVAPPHANPLKSAAIGAGLGAGAGVAVPLFNRKERAKKEKKDSVKSLRKLAEQKVAQQATNRFVSEGERNDLYSVVAKCDSTYEKYHDLTKTAGAEQARSVFARDEWWEKQKRLAKRVGR